MRRDVILAKALQGQGNDLVSHSFSKGQDMVPGMKRGDIDIALVGDLPALVMASEVDMVIAGLVKLGSGGIVSHKRNRTLADLRGKLIGVPQGANVYYGLLIALETAGMTERDVEVVFMEPDELLPALLSEQIEAMSIWPPLLDAALMDNPGLVCLQRFLNASYVVLRRSFAEQEPEAAALVLAAYLRALRWMKDDTRHLLLAAGWAKERVEIFQKQPFASLGLICATTEHDILPYAANPSIPQADREEGGQVYKLFTFMQRKGKLPVSATWPRLQKSLDSNLVRGILAQPEKYLLNTYDYGQGS
jgi:ABC-type nitrate/sulfonate/bicarbonate transport system substrate-binding protein